MKPDLTNPDKKIKKCKQIVNKHSLAFVGGLLPKEHLPKTNYHYHLKKYTQYSTTL